MQEEAFLVDKVALKRWVESDLVKDPINKTNGKGKEQEAVAEVQGGGAIVDSSGEGKMSEDTTTAGASTSNLGATSPAISTMPKDSPALSTAETAAPTTSAPKEDSLTPPASSEDGKNRSDQSNIDGTKTILNEAIVCEHGKANPAKAEQMKRVSQVSIVDPFPLSLAAKLNLIVNSAPCTERVRHSERAWRRGRASVEDARRLLSRLRSGNGSR